MVARRPAPAVLARLRPALVLAALACAGWAGAASAQVEVTDVSCATNGETSDGPAPPTVPNGHVAWPADDPVWELDLYRPANRTTLNGSGLELRDVRYRGRLVFERAGVPVLNVEYDPGVGCGCFRDWQHDEAPIDVGDARLVTSCMAQATPGAVRTACEANESPLNPTPGGDVGDFEGVVVEDFGTELVLTSHAEAGWYRYRMRWHLYADGRVWPEFSFSAADAVCTQADHRHHAYWRFDFDLEGTPRDDVVREHRGGAAQVFQREAARTWGAPTSDVFWSVRDEATGAGYEIVPSAADRRLPADAYSKADALVLRYKLDELDDGEAGGQGCAFLFEPFVDGESVEGEDVVFWYRSGALHRGGSPFECDVAGPTLRAVGYDRPAPPTGGVEVEVAGPNPSASSVTVRYRVAEDQAVTVALYDAVGRRVRVLYAGPAQAGRAREVVVERAGLAAGAYVVRVEGGAGRGAVPVVFVR